jgi:hypothetical protein
VLNAPTIKPACVALSPVIKRARASDTLSNDSTIGDFINELLVEADCGGDLHGPTDLSPNALGISVTASPFFLLLV